MKKAEIITNLYRLILEQQVVAYLSHNRVEVLFMPHDEPGNNYPQGIKALRYSLTCDEETTKIFCFADNMEEEFFRYVNRYFKKDQIQREVDRLEGNIHLARAA
jgi:hypothetical protein